MKLVQIDTAPESRPRPRSANRVDVILARDAPLIAPGRYYAIGTDRWRRLQMFKTDKLAVDFVVFVNGLDQPDEKVTLSRHWPVKFLPHGRFIVGPHSDYCREWQKVTGQKARRLDRMAPTAYAKVCPVGLGTGVHVAAQECPWAPSLFPDPRRARQTGRPRCSVLAARHASNHHRIGFILQLA
jgi:hypothetical protein